jgi:lysozyme family protein
MPAPAFSPALKASYQRLFDTCTITPDKYVFIDRSVNKIYANKARYEAVGNKLGIPWYFIGIVHNMEGNSDFTKHLHNGDPLKARTVNVPANRPKGDPPFTWEISAEDALRLTGINRWQDWSIPGVLYKLEGYNGYGYRRLAEPINTPYLWSFSNQYTCGKYVADGMYSPTAVSKQCGAAVILKRMAEKQIIRII